MVISPSRLWLTVLLGLGSWCWTMGPALAQTPPSRPAVAAPAHLDWLALTPPQRTVLAPLAEDWNQLSADSRRKWLEIATRFPSLPPEQQLRLRERMVEWARMTPAQRSLARINFQQTKLLPAQDRQAQWEAYQALPPEKREALAARARPEAASAPPRPLNQAQALRTAPLDAQAPKSNLVTAAPAQAVAPQPVGPTLVRSTTGATTRLITTPPNPPAHQQAGQPKVSVNPTQVNRTTLLPRQHSPVAASAAQRSPAPSAAVAAPPTPTASSSL